MIVRKGLRNWKGKGKERGKGSFHRGQAREKSFDWRTRKKRALREANPPGGFQRKKNPRRFKRGVTSMKRAKGGMNRRKM